MTMAWCTDEKGGENRIARKGVCWSATLLATDVTWTGTGSVSRRCMCVTVFVIHGAAEIVKHFKILVTCFSARVSRSAGV